MALLSLAGSTHRAWRLEPVNASLALTTSAWTPGDEAMGCYRQRASGVLFECEQAVAAFCFVRDRHKVLFFDFQQFLRSH